MNALMCKWKLICFSKLSIVAMAVTLASCTESGGTDEDSVSRYRLTTLFLGSEQVLGVRTDADKTFTFEPQLDDIEFFNLVVPFTHQEWNLTLIDDGTYRITNRAIGDSFSLDIINDGVFDKMKLAPSENRSGQEWHITQLDDGRCRLTTEFLGPDFSLDVTSDTSPPMLVMRSSDNVSGQRWTLTQLGTGDTFLDSRCRGPVDG